MFENLTSRLSRVLDSIRGQGRLTEDQVAAAARELRMALLEADVALPVVKDFIDKVKARALGAEILQSLSPGQQFLKTEEAEVIRKSAKTVKARSGKSAEAGGSSGKPGAGEERSGSGRRRREADSAGSASDDE